MSEASVSLLAFLFVALTATLASTYIAKTPNTAILFIVYSLGLLANFNTETSTGVLQMSGKIKYQGVINLVQSILTAGLITLCIFHKWEFAICLVCLSCGQSRFRLGIFATAFFQLTKRLGSGWWKADINSIPKVKELARFAFSSNLSATAILVFRESEILWVGYFLTSEAAGYYKVAYTIVSLLSVPANPLILTTYPEINKLVVQKAWPRLKDFLKKITTISAVYNLALGAGLCHFWKIAVVHLWRGICCRLSRSACACLSALPSTTSSSGIVRCCFRLACLSFRSRHTMVAGLQNLRLHFRLCRALAYVAEAALFSFYYIASVGAIVLRGVKEVRARTRRMKDENRTHY